MLQRVFASTRTDHMWPDPAILTRFPVEAIEQRIGPQPQLGLQRGREYRTKKQGKKHDNAANVQSGRLTSSVLSGGSKGTELDVQRACFMCARFTRAGERERRIQAKGERDGLPWTI